MEAELVRELPEGEGWAYEPKWDGFRGVLENLDGELNLWSRNGRPLLRYFPELRPLGELLAARSALDGEVVIVREGALDFDATRDGFVIGEGAGAVLVERWDIAEARGAEIYAEVLGYGGSNDAHHLAQPEPEAKGVAAMMRLALERAGVAPERVGYLNAHGTATPLGDVAETNAIKNVFGAHAHGLAVSSTKSMMGHTFGAAGAIEAIMCILALRDGVLPPTINYRTPDPECDLDYVPNEAREVQVDVALSNAMGLGGHNGCVLLGHAE